MNKNISNEYNAKHKILRMYYIYNIYKSAYQNIYRNKKIFIFITND